MSYQRIVVGLDSSEESLVALERAMPLARKFGAEIQLVHAGEVYEMGTDNAYFESESLGPYVEKLKLRQSEAHARLAVVCERYSGQGVELSVNMVEGFADNAICEAASELGAELCVVGSHGRTGVGRFLIGSVAERVVRLCASDVLVARATKSGDFRNIIVGVDFSPLCLRAIGAASKMIADGGTLTLVHSWHLPVVASEVGLDSGALAADIEDYAAGEIAKLAASIELPGVTIETKVVSGRPGMVLPDLADSADLVCVASHGRRGFRRLILGSVAEKTVRHAPCSVYVAHGG